MRTMVLIVIGLLLGALFLRLGKRRSMNARLGVFCVLWMVVVGWNLSVGLSHGYSLAEELPIQLLIWLAPYVVVGLCARQRS